MKWKNSYSNRSSFGWLLLLGIAALFLSPSVRSAVSKAFVGGINNVLKWAEVLKQKMSTAKGNFSSTANMGIELGGPRPSSGDRGTDQDESMDFGGISAEKVVQFLRRETENHSFPSAGSNQREEKKPNQEGNENDLDRLR
jgi:hypothetical protein